jgi:NADP-dependent 3-hydroxy acid dehydrogenase YdfG
MNHKKTKCIIISASSDIGIAICKNWISRGYEVFGTYRTESQKTKELEEAGANLFCCDLNNKKSLKQACSNLRKACSKWDVLISCPGTQEPIGSFLTCDFDEWEESVKINLISQLRIVHRLLPSRNTSNNLGSCVLFFAGGGTNNATINYSAYTVSKIALIKICELLDAEIIDARFAIVGPGWVKTKIHKATLHAGSKAGENYKRTLIKLDSDECTPMEEVLNCCNWIIDSPKEVVSGRNFSVVFDKWGTDTLNKKLLEENNMYKLRRFGNDYLTKKDLVGK